jgi:hypothetical protein
MNSGKPPRKDLQRRMRFLHDSSKYLSAWQAHQEDNVIQERDYSLQEGRSSLKCGKPTKKRMSSCRTLSKDLI